MAQIVRATPRSSHRPRRKSTHRDVGLFFVLLVLPLMAVGSAMLSDSESEPSAHATGGTAPAGPVPSFSAPRAPSEVPPGFRSRSAPHLRSPGAMTPRFGQGDVGPNPLRGSGPDPVSRASGGGFAATSGTGCATIPASSGLKPAATDVNLTVAPIDSALPLWVIEPKGIALGKAQRLTVSESPRGGYYPPIRDQTGRAVAFEELRPGMMVRMLDGRWLILEAHYPCP